MKKKKIGKILKYVGYVLLFITLIVCIVTTCSKKTKALEPVPNYNIYHYMGSISHISNLSGTMYWIELDHNRATYSYDNGNWVNDADLIHWSFYFDSSELQYEVDQGLKIDISELQGGVIILFGGTYNYSNEEFYIDRITTINRYFDSITNSAYSTGYTSAADTSNPLSPYNQGVADGIAQANQSQSATAEQYAATIAVLNQQIQDLQDIINSGTTPWGSFTTLLGTIFMFPITFFKEGFNVDFFGVNLGGLIVGLGMLGISIAIIGIILGKRGGN